uniref:Putative death-associated inhibitor of apoptosis 1 isoform x2 n=2 Tax=Lutzomyia longipalpis TaxID=7200 RepID=A0A7G3AFX6_LUTLO
MSGLDLFKECDRLETFAECQIENIDRDLLAKMGFYYDPLDAVVKCKFCDLSFKIWREEYYNAVLFHRVYSPLCAIVTHQALRNVPLEVDDLTRVDYEREDVSNCDRGPNEHYIDLESRLESFTDWPVGMRTRPEDLASAGFYYSGRGDIVFCFVCGLKVNQWKITDDPFEKHAKLSRKCIFLATVKGHDYIEKILEAEVIRLHELTSQDCNEIPQNEVCSVCYMRRRTIVCVPCGHFLMCEPCSESLSKCPYCGRTLSKKIQAIIR